MDMACQAAMPALEIRQRVGSIGRAGIRDHIYAGLPYFSALHPPTGFPGVRHQAHASGIGDTLICHETTPTAAWYSSIKRRRRGASRRKSSTRSSCPCRPGPLHDIGESYPVFFQQCPVAGGRRFPLRFSQPGGIECFPEAIARICKIEAFLNRQKRRVQTYGQYAQIGVDIVREKWCEIKACLLNSLPKTVFPGQMGYRTGLSSMGGAGSLVYASDRPVRNAGAAIARIRLDPLRRRPNSGSLSVPPCKLRTVFMILSARSGTCCSSHSRNNCFSSCGRRRTNITRAVGPSLRHGFDDVFQFTVIQKWDDWGRQDTHRNPGL